MNQQMLERYESITRPQIEIMIADFLAAQEPATLEQICRELGTQQKLKPAEVLPIAIIAIAAMQEQGLICKYEQMPFTDPLDYAWVLAEEYPHRNGDNTEAKANHKEDEVMTEETTNRIFRAPYKLKDKVQSIVCQIENFEHWLVLLPDKEDIRAEFPIAMEALIKDIKESIILASPIGQSIGFNEPAIAVLTEWLEARAKSLV